MKSKIFVGLCASLMFMVASANAVDFNSSVVNYNMGTVSLPVKVQTPVSPVIATSTSSTSTPVTTSTSTATNACVAHIKSFHKLGSMGDEVKTLQAFLNDFNGASLNEKGYYGPITEKEVRNFQYTYGIKVTGVQHVKTTEMINNIICGKVAKKDRVVYPHAVTMSSIKPISVSTYKNSKTSTIYPNTPDVKVKDNKNMATNTIDTMATTSSSTFVSSFTDSLKSDFNKIKENYKAYLLVFALVLALFWFLRKAATE